MAKSTSLLVLSGAAFIAAGALAVSTASAATSPFKAGVDADGNGHLDVEEFVMAMGEREMGRRDTNKDGQLSSAEWLGKNQGDFQKLTLERFNTDGDDVMSASEIVEVFSWVFEKRDKDSDGKLTAAEAPKFLRSS